MGLEFLTCWKSPVIGLNEILPGRCDPIRISPESNAAEHSRKRPIASPDLALYKIRQAAYKFSFLLVPISVPFIALLFLWKRGVTVYDHVVYTLYASRCFL
jgi:hypothetical protein